MAVKDPIAAKMIREAAQADDLTVIEVSSENQSLANGRPFQPSLIVLEWEPDHDAQLYNKGARDIPIIIVAPIEDEAVARAMTHVQEWLIKPFSSAYARTRIRACLLRTACHWERALTSDEEENRLATLRDLGILDTPPEDRFDRITRLAASILKVPIALVSLVDRERQWFKSSYGLNVAETSREVSFCSHAVASQEVLVISDTLQDPRFADNPLVTDPPRIRFYAGCPIFVEEACVGTLCVLDDRPHQIDAERIRLLRELAALAETELRKPQSG